MRAYHSYNSVRPILKFEISERHVPDDGVDAVLREVRVAKTLNLDILFRVERMPSGARPMKWPIPHPGSRTVASWGTPRCLSASCMARITRGEV
jgi:hypothetical protein